MKKLYWLQHDEFQDLTDIVFEIVVRADNEGEAREIASESSKSEGEEIWKDSIRSSCTELTGEGPSVMIMRAYT